MYHFFFPDVLFITLQIEYDVTVDIENCLSNYITNMKITDIDKFM